MGIVFDTFLHFPDSWVLYVFFVKIHLLASYFGISRSMGIFPENLPNL